VTFARAGNSFRFWVVVNDRRTNRYFGGNQAHDVQGDSRWIFYANSAGVQRHPR
jgi:hypothetical protein